jgi:tetrapyrrole methylase family protein/MazG family protein
MTADTLPDIRGTLTRLLTDAGLTDTGWTQVIDAAEIAILAAENAVGEVPGSDRILPWRAPLPVAATIVTGVRDLETARAAALWLARFYPPEHEVTVLGPAGQESEATRTTSVAGLSDLADLEHHTILVVPPLPEMENVRTFTGMMQLTRRLRGPGGCPWDREQSHATLKPYLLEEAYEVLDALDGGDSQQIAEEFGDLLYQITLHAQVAAEAGTYTIEDVIESIMVKLIGRHPHVFGDLELESAQDVRHAWESFKQRQKPKRESVLEEIPRGLPALPQSNLMQKRAASVGFAWPDLAAVVAKAAEELDELRAEVETAAPKERRTEELGDLLFALVGIARRLKIDPEEALRGANHKFAERFGYLERQAREQGLALRDMPVEEMMRLWNEAKDG